MDMERARANMIARQIRPWGVHDTRILALLPTLRREEFVPAPWRAQAFADMQIPLRDSAAALAAGQVMLPPRLEARLLQELQLAGHEKVLEIGAGSGFMATLLGRMAQRVISAELDEELARSAQQNLERAGVLNVQVRAGDGVQIALSDGPFDAILLSGAVTAVPEALIYQLNPGGRLLAITGEAPATRATLMQRNAGGASTAQPWDAEAPPLRGALAPENLPTRIACDEETTMNEATEKTGEKLRAEWHREDQAEERAENETDNLPEGLREAARQLLADGNMPAEAIALTLGIDEGDVFGLAAAQ